MHARAHHLTKFAGQVWALRASRGASRTGGGLANRRRFSPCFDELEDRQSPSDLFGLYSANLGAVAANSADAGPFTPAITSALAEPAADASAAPASSLAWAVDLQDAGNSVEGALGTGDIIRVSPSDESVALTATGGLVSADELLDPNAPFVLAGLPSFALAPLPGAGGGATSAGPGAGQASVSVVPHGGASVGGDWSVTAGTGPISVAGPGDEMNTAPLLFASLGGSVSAANPGQGAAAPTGSSTPAAAPAEATAAAPTLSTTAVGAAVGHLMFGIQPGQNLNPNEFVPPDLLAGATVTQSGPGVYDVVGDGTDLAPLQQFLASSPVVSYVEVPQPISLALSANDPSYVSGSLWGLSGSNGIQAPEAWDATLGSTKVSVAVIDSGIDYNHPDLYMNIWVNQGEIPGAIKSTIQANPNWDVDGDNLITFWDLNDARNQGSGKAVDVNADGRITGTDLLAPIASGGWANGISDNGDAYQDDLIGWDWVNNDNDPADDNSHGTHVAGTIGGVSNNSTGVAGINWKSQLMALKVLNGGGGGTTSAAAAATYYATDLGARVSNNSWGGGGSASLFNAITYAGTRGHVFVAAAGNAGSDNDASPFYPASYNMSNVVSVAATDGGGGLAGFSNFGATSVDLGAPGVGIVSTVPGGGYGSKSGTSMATPHVAGVMALVAAQHPTWSAEQLAGHVLGTTTSAASLAGRTLTGGLLNAAAATIQGPEVTVLDGTAGIQDNTGVVNLRTLPGSAVTKTFTVRNGGTENLTVGPSINVSSGLTLVSGLGATTLAPGASTTFTVRFEPTATAGTYTSTISFATNDTDESPFNFTVSTLVTTAVMVDNGDSGFATSGSWSYWTGQGYQDDIHQGSPGTGSDTATWTFSVTPGQYRVSATWSANSNRASNAPFTVLDGTSALGTVRLNQRVAANDFTDDGAAWEDVGTFTVTGSSLLVRLGNNADGYLNADAVRIERAAATTPAPEVQVLDGSTDIADGSGSVSFGSTTAGAAVVRTFTVKNVGTQDLTLGAVSVPTGFSLASGPGSTTLGPGVSTTFTVRLDATASGSFSGTVSFATNDADENPFNFTVAGTVTTPSTVQTIDNGDTGFGTSGSWSYWTGQGFQGDIHQGSPGSGSDTATWTFNVTPGQYRVSATWSAFSNRASNAPFTVLDGTAALGTVRLNQKVAANDFTDQATAWEDVGTFTVSGGTLVVRLGNNADGYLNADAIRIERVAATTPAPEVQVLDGSTDIADGSGSISFGSTTAGAAVVRTFTVKNVGTQDLTLGAVSVPAGFTLAAGPGSTTLAPGTSTTFTVRLDATAAGSFSGTVSFATNDADENPFNFTVAGTVTTVTSVQTIDNGEAGFSTSGSWSYWTGQGFQGDVHQGSPGTGSDAATWTFSVTPGQYRVSATWSTHSNRASNAPFTVLDGTSALGTVRLNQRVAANDFSDAGAAWENLGTFTVSGGTLVVRLGTDADGYLNADAIRIERVG